MSGNDYFRIIFKRIIYLVIDFIHQGKVKQSCPNSQDYNQGDG